MTSNFFFFEVTVLFYQQNSCFASKVHHFEADIKSLLAYTLGMLE